MLYDQSIDVRRGHPRLTFSGNRSGGDIDLRADNAERVDVDSAEEKPSGPILYLGLTHQHPPAFGRGPGYAPKPWFEQWVPFELPNLKVFAKSAFPNDFEGPAKGAVESSR